jgi:hypothetical protein
MLLADYQSFQQTPCTSGCKFLFAAMFLATRDMETFKKED